MYLYGPTLTLQAQTLISIQCFLISLPTLYFSTTLCVRLFARWFHQPRTNARGTAGAEWHQWLLQYPGSETAVNDQFQGRKGGGGGAEKEKRTSKAAQAPPALRCSVSAAAAAATTPCRGVGSVGRLQAQCAVCYFRALQRATSSTCVVSLYAVPIVYTFSTIPARGTPTVGCVTVSTQTASFSFEPARAAVMSVASDPHHATGLLRLWNRKRGHILQRRIVVPNDFFQFPVGYHSHRHFSGGCAGQTS